MSLPFLYSTAINEPLPYTLSFSLFFDRKKLKDTSFPYIISVRQEKLPMLFLTFEDLHILKKIVNLHIHN